MKSLSVDDPIFRQQDKHVFCFTWGGRPVYSRLGQRMHMLPFFAAMLALVSLIQASGNTPRVVRTGDRIFVFETSEPLLFVAVGKISCNSENQLRQELRMLRSQLLSVLTPAILEAVEHRPTLDVSSQLQGTDMLLHALVDSFEYDHSYALRAIAPLRFPADKRAQLAQIVKDARQKVLKKETELRRSIACAVVVAGDRVVILAQSKRASLCTGDLLLLLHFVRHMYSLRGDRDRENWSPVCLPQLADVPVHVHTRFVRPDIAVALVSLDATLFQAASRVSEYIAATAQESGLWDDVETALNQGDCDIGVDQFNQALSSLRHLCVHSTNRQQWFQTTPALPYVVRNHADLPMQRPQGTDLFRLVRSMFARLESLDTEHDTPLAEMSDAVEDDSGLRLVVAVHEKEVCVAWRTKQLRAVAVLAPLVSPHSVATTLPELLKERLSTLEKFVFADSLQF
ncbi:MAG: hypothetical protein MHM6MM_005401 [Cercozoa sp. M6MM]